MSTNSNPLNNVRLLHDYFFQRKKTRAITRDYSCDHRSEGEEKISVELRPEFEVESSALHCIGTVCNYQRTTTAERVVHISAVAMAIHVLRLEDS